MLPSEAVFVPIHTGADLFSASVIRSLELNVPVDSLTANLKTLIMGQPLNASKVFSSMTIFDILRYVLSRHSRFFDAINCLLNDRDSIAQVRHEIARAKAVDLTFFRSPAG